MSSRTRRTLVATAPDGTEVTEQTSGGYTVAGLIQHTTGNWVIATHGTSWNSVTNRTSMMYGRGYYNAFHISNLIEVTAPVLRKYFGTHSVTIMSVYRPGTYQGISEEELQAILLDGYRATWSHVTSAIKVAQDHPDEKGHAGVQVASGIAAISYEHGMFSLEIGKAAWEPVCHRSAGRSDLRYLAREGITAIQVLPPSGPPAEFQMPEIINSLNARS